MTLQTPRPSLVGVFCWLADAHARDYKHAPKGTGDVRNIFTISDEIVNPCLLPEGIRISHAPASRSGLFAGQVQSGLQWTRDHAWCLRLRNAQRKRSNRSQIRWGVTHRSSARFRTNFLPVESWTFQSPAQARMANHTPLLTRRLRQQLKMQCAECALLPECPMMFGRSNHTGQGLNARQRATWQHSAAFWRGLWASQTLRVALRFALRLPVVVWVSGLASGVPCRRLLRA